MTTASNEVSGQLSTDALKNSGWRDVVSSVERSDSSSYFHAFLPAARAAEEKGESGHARVLEVLARASSLLLQPSSVNEPFGPLAVYDGNRTPIVEDFSDTEIDFIAQAVQEVDDPWLQARLADLVWLLRRDHQAALVAIDAYRQIPLAADPAAFRWQHCWERAIRLARMLRDGPRLEAMERDILDALEQAEPGLALSLSELLLETALGTDEADRIAEVLGDGADALEVAGKHALAIECFEAAATWYSRTKDEDGSATMRTRVGDLWTQQAQAHLSSDQPSNLNARFAAENALKAYRRVPRQYREDLGVDSKIEQIRAMLEQAGTGSLNEMGVISSPEIDISDEVAKARRWVRGKPLPDALEAFATLHQGASMSSLVANAKETLAAHPVQALLTARHLSADGRVVGKSSSETDRGGGSWAPDGATRRQVLRDYEIEVSFVVQAAVWPALQELNLEHRITERELLAVALSSPLVPPKRERLFAKALAAGFDRDFATALHLLVPQVENLVRFHLKQRGVFTTTVKDGIEMEVGLSSLLDKSEAQDIFGEDHAFELRALFTDPIGSNFRNDVAHGLLDYDSTMSLASAYAWWWCFRWVYLTYRQALAVHEGKASGGDSEGHGETPEPSDDSAPEPEKPK